MPDVTGRRCAFHYLAAINLLESMGVALGDIYLKAVGEYENYAGEVRSQAPAPGTAIPPGSIVTLDVGCYSAVDFLPYQFFYGFQGIRDSDNTWETAARALMAPFDAAAIRYAARMRMQRLRFDFGIMDAAQIRRFTNLFDYRPGDEPHDAEKDVFLAAVLPSLHLWGGNPSAVAAVLERLFGYRVLLKENVKASTPIPEDIRCRLGSGAAKLGAETVIGGSFEEYDSRYEVEFSGVPPGDLRHLMPGGKKRRAIEKFLDFCTPGDIDCTIVVKVDRGAARTGRKQYLGFSTFL